MNKTIVDFPELLARWDYSKNTLLPSQVTRYSKVDIWWKCPVCKNSSIHKPNNLHLDIVGCQICKGNPYYFLGKDGTYAIYCHTTPDGKKYIGMTSMPIKTRFGNGRHYYSQSFTDAIKKFGWNNIVHEILEYGLNEEDAAKSEIKYINMYDTLNPNKGYNVATGGKHGYIPNRKLTKETRMKISTSHKGLRASDEAKKKMSLSHKGLDNHQQRSVLQFSLDGELLNEYSSLKQAAESNGICDNNSIWRVCNGQRKTAGGFIWKYK